MRRRSRWPSSGKSAMSAHDVTGPTPGTERSSSSASRQIGVERIRVVEVGLEAPEGVVQPGDMGLEMALQAAITKQTSAVLLGAEHVDQLAATRDQVPKGARLFVGHGPGDGANGFGKARDHPSVERVGLGQLPSGPREVADLPGIDHGDGQPRPGQRGGDGDLVAAGRFQDDDGGSERPHAGDERDESCVVVADAKGLAGGEDVDIEVGFRDVDTNEAGMFHDPSLHMRALSAQATVRVR